MAERLVEYGDWPKCPRCGWDQFDDWWHALDAISVKGRLTCECGVFFISGAPGRMVTSHCHGVRRDGYQPLWTERPWVPDFGALGNPVSYVVT